MNIDTRNLIQRLLYPMWDKRIAEELGEPALERFGIIKDPDSPDEEMDYSFVFFPSGRESTSFVIIQLGSYERMENILEELRRDGHVALYGLCTECSDDRIRLVKSQ